MGTVEQNIKVKIDALVSGLAEVKKLQKELQGIEGASGGSTSKLDILGKIGGTSLGAIVGPATAAAAAIAGVSAAGVGLLATLYNLAKGSADSTGKFIDLSQQTGFAVETLSTLDIVAQTSGGSIENVTNSLFIFTKNMGEANGKSKEMTKLFRENHISTVDQEKGLRDALAALNKLTVGEGQATLAAQLFSRGSKEILAVLKETGGSLDAATEKFRKMGLLITSDVARAGDEAADKFRLFEIQLERVKEKIGAQLTPTFLQFAQEFSDFLRNNPHEVEKWGNDLVSIVHGVASALGALRATFGTWSLFFGGEGPEGFKGSANGPKVIGNADLIAKQGLIVSTGQPGSTFGRRTTAPDNVTSSPADFGDTGIFTQRPPRISGGGTTKRPEETADDRGRRLLQQLAEQCKELGVTRESSRVLIQLERKDYVGLSEAVKQQILAQAALNEAKKRSLEQDDKRAEGRKGFAAFVLSQIEALHQLTYGEDTATDALEKQIRVLREHGSTLDKEGTAWEDTFERYTRFIALTIDVKKRLEDIFKYLSLIANFEDTSGREQTDPFAHIFDGTPPPVPGEKQEKSRSLLDDLKDFAKSDGLSQLVDALTAFASGAESAQEAFRQFALSVIADVEQMVVKFLVLAAVKALLGALGGGGGGLDSGLTSVFAGGAGGGLGFAEGGAVPATPGGRVIMVAEGGHDEVVLTTDPKHRDRTAGLLGEFLSRTGIIPQLASGGFVRGVLNSVSPSIPRLAAGGFVEAPSPASFMGGDVNVRINQPVTIQTKDAQSFRNSRQQVERDLARAATRGVKRIRP